MTWTECMMVFWDIRVTLEVILGDAEPFRSVSGQNVTDWVEKYDFEQPPSAPKGTDCINKCPNWSILTVGRWYWTFQ